MFWFIARTFLIFLEKRVKTKIKNKILFFAIALFIFLTMFLVCKKISAESDCDHIIISEIYGGGGNSGAEYSHDFVELYNPTKKDVGLDDWSIQYASSSGSFSASKLTKLSGIIKSERYYLIEEKDGSNEIKELPEPDAEGSINLSASSGKIALANNSSVIDSETDISVVGFVAYSGGSNAKSIYRKDFSCSDNFSTHSPDPQNSSYIKPEPKVYSDKIRINELLPRPTDKSGLEEFVELYNPNDQEEDLDGWVLKDRAGKTCKISDEKIDSLGFLVLKNNPAKNCTLALNDTRGEDLYLYNPESEIPVSSVSYDGSAKKDISYSFDEKKWRWTKFITEGEENVFEKVPKGTLDIDEDVYVNVYADFKILGLSKKAKVVWSFGDDHKSYLQKTRHKYEKVGKYKASLKYSEGSEEVVKDFTVEVKKFPHPKVRIISINANPPGKDSENETITLENKSKKKINLKGWSIATGWKKLYNHPITENFEIKAGKEKEITRDFSKFTLNNKKTKIELRYPDGKVADDIKYKKEKGIKEGEIYQKGKSKWEWKAGPEKSNSKKEPEQKIEEKIEQPETTIIETEPQEENPEELLGKYSKFKNKKQDIEIKLLGFQDKKINSGFTLKYASANQPFVLGASTVRISHFNSESFSKNFFLKKYFFKINLFLNNFISNLLN